MTMTPRQRKCNYCKDKFTPFNSFQKFCFKDECIKEHAQAEKEKQNKKRKQEFKANDKSLQLKLTQTVINKWVRIRDKEKPCISCGTTNNIQYHAGHFIPQGNNQQLRFNLLNIHKQCSVCNNHLSGNLIAYKENLIKKIGKDRVEVLEGDKTTKKYSIEYLTRMREIFNKRIRLYERKFR